MTQVFYSCPKCGAPVGVRYLGCQRCGTRFGEHQEFVPVEAKSLPFTPLFHFIFTPAFTAFLMFYKMPFLIAFFLSSIIVGFVVGYVARTQT